MLYSLIHLPQVEIRESHSIAFNMAVTPAASHTIQPVHVDTRPTPEWSTKNHAPIGLGHIAHIAPISTNIKAGSAPLLLHPDIDLSRSLVVRHCKGPVSIDGAPVLRAHHVWIDPESIGLASAPVAIVPISVSARAGVQGGGHGVLVALPGVVLGAPDVVAKVGIAVVIAVTRIVSGHFDKVTGRVAVTFNPADINGVAEVFVIQGGLES